MKTISKKALILCLVLLMVLSAIACAAPATEPAASAQTGTEPETAPPEQPAEAAETKEPLKIGLCVAGTLGDESMNDNHLQGVQTFIDEYDGEVIFNYAEAVNFEDHERNARNFAEQGYDLVLIGLAAHNDVLAGYAPEYPDTMFWQNQGSISDVSNVACTTGCPQQGNFACGYFAVKMSEELGYGNKVGWVGGQRNPALERGMYGFMAGAEYAGGEASIAYVGNFTDTAKGMELANQMMDNGIHFIMPWAGGAGTGVQQAVVAKGEGYYCFGGGSSDKPNFFQAPGSIIACATDNADRLTYYACKQFAEGTLQPGVTTVGMKEGYSDVVFSPDLASVIPQSALDATDKIREDIISGTIVCPKSEDEYNAFAAEFLKK